MIEALLNIPVLGEVVRLLALGLLATAATLTIAFVYTVRSKSSFPDGATVLVGLGTVALFLNTRIALSQFIGGEAEALTVDAALWNIVAFALATVGSFGGRWLAEALARSGRVSLDELSPVLSPIVRATGRFITVELPEEIDDVEGYDPIPPETKDALAGARLDFPRGLTVEELSDHLVDRLKEKHHVGYVDLELSEEGTVEHLALGKIAIGLGPALPPRHVATAIRADPPLAASAGDTVGIWTTGSAEAEATRVARGEVRATVGDVATVAVPEAVAHALDPETTYRLVTHPGEAHADREFASMLRRSEETMTTIELSEQSPLVGRPIRELELTVIAIQRADGTVQMLPTSSTTIQAGDRLHAIGRPANLRALITSPGATVHEASASMGDAG